MTPPFASALSLLALLAFPAAGALQPPGLVPVVLSAKASPRRAKAAPVKATTVKASTVEAAPVEEPVQVEPERIPAAVAPRSAAPKPAPVLLAAKGATEHAPRSPTRVPEAASTGWRFERLGLGIGALGEGSRMEGESWIHTFRQDESFNYGRTGPVFSIWGMGQILPRLWLGPAVRVMGGYASDNYDFGLLQEVGLVGEWALPIFEHFEIILGGRANGALLIPGGDFSKEIERLQGQGAGVWSVPRVGWTAGIGAGLRRQMAERFWLRLDASAQMGRIFLFSTDSRVDELRFRKYWSAGLSRFEFAFAAEVAL